MKQAQTLLKGAVGIEALQQFLSKHQGFNAVLKKMTVIAAENGKCVAELKVDKEHTNSKETLHGGLIMTLIDAVTTCALKTNLKSTDAACLSTNLNVKFFNKANIGDTISVLGEVIKYGKSMGFLSCTVVHKDNGNIVATGTHTMYIVSKDQRKV